MPIENNHTQLKVDIASIKKDIKNSRDIHIRIDNAIEKLTDVATSIKQMLAVHEEKISQQEAADKALYELVESRRAETENTIKEVHVESLLPQKN